MRSLIGTQNVGFTIIAQKPYSNNAADGYLAVVLGEKVLDDGTLKCVTWIYNEQIDGFSLGDYFFAPTEDAYFSARGHALESFNARGKIRGITNH